MKRKNYKRFKRRKTRFAICKRRMHRIQRRDRIRYPTRTPYIRAYVQPRIGRRGV